ncbi:MAG: beta-ketoacyl synthase N-terminal-like domain-containing protein, partial [Myxococcota bacterium]
MASVMLGRRVERGILGDALGTPPKPPWALNRWVCGLPAGVLARALGLGGGHMTLDAACASSLYALGLAVDALQAHRADAMLTGGLSRPDALYTQMGFCQLRALSAKGRCTPFDARGDGLVVGEGAGVMLLKRLSDALEAGDTIYAVVRGVGLSNDTDGSLLAPSREGQLRAMRTVYDRAGWSPSDVDMIECHATGTPVGDRVEYTSLRALWGEAGWSRGQCVLGAVKANVGHLLTGAGAVGLIKVLLAMRHEVLPPGTNFERPAEGIDLDVGPFRIPSAAEPWERRSTTRRAAVSGFGFGGTNAHVLLEEFREAPTFVPAPSPPKLEQPVVAVVGLAAHVGPWDHLKAFQRRVLGGDGAQEPKAKAHGWGGDETSQGWFIDQLEVPYGAFRIPPRELEESLPQQVLMLQVAAAALEDAGGVPKREWALRTGVFIGIELDLTTTDTHLRWSIREQGAAWAQALGQPLDGDALDAWTTALSDAVTPPLTANRTMGRLGEITASRVAREFGLGGPSYTVSGEECSGLVGLDVAVRALQRGDLDRALVGAVDLPGEFRAQLASGLVRPTSAEGQARPFDRAASGTVYGDGAVAMVLKRLEDAERDGDSVYAVVRGIGLATGGEATALAPTAEAQAQSMERALADAAVDAATIGLVEAHGSAVPMEDQTEAQALTRVWGGQEGAAPVLGSVKADVGHTGAAAGLVSAVKACLCLDQAIVPPLRGVGRLQRGLDTFVHPTKPRYWLYNSAQAPRRALVTAQSTSGLAASVVLEAAPSPQPPQGEEHRPTPKHPPTQGHLAAKAHHAAEEHPHHALGQAPGPRPVAEHGPPTQGRLAVRTARRPLGPGPEQLFVFEAETPHGLMAQLDRLAALVEEGHPPRSAAEWAQQWWAKTGRQEEATLGLALVAENHSALKRRLVQARHAVATGVDPGGWVRYSPRPLGREGELAFVFPGSGSQFAGMGRSMGVEWPAVLDAQQDRVGRLRDQLLPEVIWDATAITDRARDLILAQVSLGTLVSDLVRSFGV